MNPIQTIKGERNNTQDYWIWAGILPRDAPLNEGLYIYQGVIIQKEGNIHFVKKGLFPHPIIAKKLYLVFRLEGSLPDPTKLANLILIYVANWQRYRVSIEGIQLDFDSPSARLLQYNNFLVDFRKAFPRNYKVSITGLGDWVLNGNREILTKMARSIDEIVFQLYQNRNQLAKGEIYVNKLMKLDFPFKVGFLIDQSYQKYIAKLSKSEYYLGEVFFLQKQFIKK